MKRVVWVWALALCCALDCTSSQALVAERTTAQCLRGGEVQVNISVDFGEVGVSTWVVKDGVKELPPGWSVSDGSISSIALDGGASVEGSPDGERGVAWVGIQQEIKGIHTFTYRMRAGDGDVEFDGVVTTSAAQVPEATSTISGVAKSACIDPPLRVIRQLLTEPCVGGGELAVKLDVIIAMQDRARVAKVSIEEGTPPRPPWQFKDRGGGLPDAETGSLVFSIPQGMVDEVLGDRVYKMTVPTGGGRWTFDGSATVTMATSFGGGQAVVPIDGAEVVECNVAPTRTPKGCCLGDADSSGFVNTFDFRAVRQNFGKEGGTGDADCSGFVNTFDFRSVRQEFGHGCGN